MKNLTEMQNHFPRFAASTILMSALQSMNGSMLENAYEDPALRPCSLPFVEYRRLLTGIPEAYAMFIWDKVRFPDVKIYMDVLLCINYVKSCRCGQRTCSQILSQVIGEIGAAKEGVDTILGEGEPEMYGRALPQCTFAFIPLTRGTI
ncbi:hypothetical protein AcV7_001398 [Taiwanofungus camphoratus]|nr:hypothetical protein AcV7_001398 [Antrodia cinnamomea]